MSSEHDEIQWELEVLLPGGERVTVREDYRRLVESISVHQVWDGADTLTLKMRAWDDVAVEYRVVGETIFQLGTEIILSAGYGSVLNAMGKFTVARHEPKFGVKGVTVDVIGHDGFAHLVDDKWPGDYGSTGETQRYSDLGLIMARKYGWGFAGDVSREVPDRSVERRYKSGRNADGTPAYKTRKVGSRIVKNAGDTDATMLKTVAGFCGFMHPKVRWVENGSALHRSALRDYDIQENVGGRDVLFFRAPNIQRQSREVGTFVIPIIEDGSTTAATGVSFNPKLSSEHIPTAVRVTGYVVDGDGVRVLRTVEAEITDEGAVRRRSRLLAKAAREPDLAKRTALQREAQSIGGQVAITRSDTRVAGKQDQERFRNVGTMLTELLSNEQQPGMEYDAQKKTRVQTLRREVLGTTVHFGSASEIEDFARAYLVTRMDYMLRADVELDGVIGAHLLYPQQVHQFTGLSGEYVGFYMLQEATHTIARGSHKVSASVQRVAQEPTRIGRST